MQVAPLAHSIKEVVRLTGFGRTSVYAEIAEGRLVAHKIGRRTLVYADDLGRWLASQPTIRPRQATTKIG